MQTVSNAWKSNQSKTITNEGFVEVSLGVADPDALADASSQDNGAVYISNTSQVVSEVDRNIVPYSTLERNMWVLDGTRKTIPVSDWGDSGYVSDILCDGIRSFKGKTPVITVRFSRVHQKPVPAVTITWGKTYGEFAEAFTIRAYNGDTIVAEKEVSGNKSVTSVVMMDIINYDRITISVLRWCLPYHRARVEEIYVGMRKVYSKRDLFAYSHTQTVNPLSTSLPKMEVSFSVDNTDNSYDVYNVSGLSKYLMERQEIKTRYGYKMDDKRVEWIKGGTFYLSEWRAPQNGMEADFTARDLLEYLFAEYVDEVSEISSRNLYDIAEAILLSADLPLNSDGTRKWKIDESLREVYTSAILPIDTKANCLLMIANAGQCVLYQDRDGTIRIEPLANDTSDYSISLSNSYSKPEIELSKVIKEVVVKVYQYSIVEGEVETTSSEMVIATGESGEQVKVDNPLITDMDRARAVGEWVREYISHRITLDVQWRADVRLDALDKVQVDNDYGYSTAIMTDVEFKFNGSFSGSGKGKVI